MKIRYFLFLVSVIVTIFACKKNDTQTDKNTYQPIFIDHFIDDWTCAVNPGVGGNFDVAEFRLWVPDASDVPEVKAILILAESSNSNATDMAKSPEWRAYAVANKVALMGVHLQTKNPLTVYDTYADARAGSGEALIKALEAITARNHISKIAALPFLLRGYSAGGMFSYFFAAYQPKRVIAFANIRGWIIGQTDAETKNIPGLFLIGEVDTPFFVQRDVIQKIVEAKRKENALWSYAIESGADHFAGLKASDDLIKLFFSSALKYRLGITTTDLLMIAPSSGWLGNNETRAFFPYHTYPDEKEKAGWLIDEDFAKAWKEYQKK